MRVLANIDFSFDKNDVLLHNVMRATTADLFDCLEWLRNCLEWLRKGVDLLVPIGTEL